MVGLEVGCEAWRPSYDDEDRLDKCGVLDVIRAPDSEQGEVAAEHEVCRGIEEVLELALRHVRVSFGQLHTEGRLEVEPQLEFAEGRQLHLGLRAGAYDAGEACKRRLRSGPQSRTLDEAAQAHGELRRLERVVDIGAVAPYSAGVFFESTKTGPWKLVDYVGKPKIFLQHTQATFDQWEKEARDAMCAKEVDRDIAEGVEEHRKQVHSVAMQRAREMAQQALARKKAKREIDLSDPAPAPPAGGDE